MDPGMIGRLRRGQAEERDRRLAVLLIERGILTSDEAHELRSVSDPGAFGEMLVRTGRLSAEHGSRLEREAGVREILDNVSNPTLPLEVVEALKDTRVRVTKYVRVHLMGEGGMGEVWKAWDGQLGRWVALKIVKFDDPETVQRFMREANLLSKLCHPRIPRVYEVGVQSLKPFLAMEFVDGRSLTDARLEPRRAAAVIRDAARAVQYAHDQGIIHRDLKPANIMESTDGRTFVTDFGLARLLSAGGTMTMTGSLLGTPSYMAPEQALGRTAIARTDVYQLGATLYALLTGHPPFLGPSATEVIQKIVDEPTPVLEPRGDLSMIVRKAMERDPRDRYFTAGVFADDLDRYLEDEPVVANPIGPLGRVLRRMRRRPLVPAVAALVLGLLALWAVFAVRRFREEERWRRAEAALARARTIIPDLQRMSIADSIDANAFDRALSDFEAHVAAALAIAPEYPPALYYQGEGLCYRRRHADAEGVLTRALERDPANHDARALRGRARFFLMGESPVQATHADGVLRFEILTLPPEAARRVAAAEEDFMALPEEHPFRSYGLALISFARGDTVTAREKLRAVLKARPYLMEARHILAMAELCGEFYGEAEFQASRAIGLGFQDPLVYETRAYARAGQGKLAPAVEDALTALARNRNAWVLKNFAADWLSRLGRYEESFGLYEEIIAHEPGRTDHRFNYAAALLKSGDRKKARAVLDGAIRIDPGSAQAHLRRGELSDDPDEAIAFFTKAIERDKGLAEAYALRGRRYSEIGKKAEARRDFLKAVVLDPNGAVWFLWLGQDYLAANDFDAAEAAFATAIRLAPGNATAYAGRGLIRHTREDYKGALEDYEKAVQLDERLRAGLKVAMDDCRKHLGD